tara:strand:- start:27639 stop:29036 length:1398 start_codon:yes stop_codon:yes gene_type:complete
VIYKQSRNGMGHLVVHRVPIFVECKRGDTDYNAAWLNKAVRAASVAELEGYFPPLHIRHHGDGNVESAGFFKITGAGPITFKGTTKTAVFADLVITAPWVEDSILAARLPYRSVEIIDVDQPAFSSLALLDHEPPYLELPMLMVAQADAEDSTPRRPGDSPGSLTPVANATFANPWQAESLNPDSMVVACFRRGSSAHILFQDQDETPMAVKKTNTPAPKGAHFADDKYEKDDGPPKKEGDDGDKMEGDEGALDIAAVCKAIGDGSISVAEMEEIKAAIIAQQGEVAAEPEEEEAPAAAPAPAPGEAMSKNQSTHFAKLQGKIDAQDAKINAMETKAVRAEAIANALETLEGRPLGADPEAKFGKFFDDHGAAAFSAYVAEYKSTFAAMSTNGDTKNAAFAAQKNGAATGVALAYTEQGTEAVTKAAQFAAEHKQLGGRVKSNEASYVSFNMARAGFAAPTPAAK